MPLIQSGLPKYMWTYALATSGYTRNRCYLQRTRSTPFELFTGKIPNHKNIVPFGTKCFVYVVNHKRKLDDRSQKGVFYDMIVSLPLTLFMIILSVLYVNHGM